MFLASMSCVFFWRFFFFFLVGHAFGWSHRIAIVVFYMGGVFVHEVVKFKLGFPLGLIYFPFWQVAKRDLVLID